MLIACVAIIYFVHLPLLVSSQKCQTDFSLLNLFTDGWRLTISVRGCASHGPVCGFLVLWLQIALITFHQSFFFFFFFYLITFFFFFFFDYMCFTVMFHS